jgi:aldehyde:ferredoxin oxidoreductase
MAAATGISDFADVKYLWKVGERIYNLERMFNVREGFGIADDVMPERFSTETMQEGPSKGQIFEAKELLRDYYLARGWDTNTGVPTDARLKELDLAFTIGK